MTARQQVEYLARRLRERGLSELEIEQRDLRLHLVLAGSKTECVKLEVLGSDERSARLIVRSPGVGMFLREHPTSSRKLFEAGDGVASGQLLGLLAVGLLFRPIASPIRGQFARQLCDHGSRVEYGTPLFELIEFVQPS